MKYKFRQSFNGKLILQIGEEVVYWVGPITTDKVTKTIWRDAKAVDFLEEKCINIT